MGTIEAAINSLDFASLKILVGLIVVGAGNSGHWKIDLTGDTVPDAGNTGRQLIARFKSISNSLWEVVA